MSEHITTRCVEGARFGTKGHLMQTALATLVYKESFKLNIAELQERDKEIVLWPKDRNFYYFVTSHAFCYC